MRLMIILLSLMFSMGALATEITEVKTFKEWKSEKVQDAIQKVVEHKTKFSALQRQGNTSKDMLSRLSQAEFNLEISRDLTVSDYFDIYLKSQENFEKTVALLATKLSPNEVAEMLIHFSNSTKVTPSLENHEVKIAEELKSSN